MISIARVAASAQKELDIAKTEMVKIAKVAAAAQRELDIARGQTRLLNTIINGLQRALTSSKAGGASTATSCPWSPARRTTAGDLDQVRADPTHPAEPPGVPSDSAPSHHSAGRRSERVLSSRSSEEWRDEWLSAEYHSRCAPPRKPVRPRRPAPVPEPI